MAEKSKIFMLAEQLKAAKDKKKELEDMVDTITAEIEKLDKQLSDEMAKEECPTSRITAVHSILQAVCTLLRRRAARKQCSQHSEQRASEI